MKDYFLFIDIETSGIPGRWDRPLADKGNWPSTIQVAWIVCNLNGTELKRTSNYIYEKDITITPESLKVHGIGAHFLEANGVKRKEVLRKLAHDIKKFDPLVIGHFLELDLQVLSADYLRAQLLNPFIGRSLFCTMLKSKEYVLNPTVNYLRLSQLYKHLFKKKPDEVHHAERDAELTAACFFELRRLNELMIKDFKEQQVTFSKKLNFLNKDIL